MRALHQQRCLNHASREAVARCPSCTRYFCRECITEHEDRVICAGCLKKLTRQEERRPLRLGWMVRGLQFAVAFLVIWFAFYHSGRGLLKIPANVHDGTLWKSGVFDEEKSP